MATSVFLDLHNKFRSLPNLLCLIFCIKNQPLTPVISSRLGREDQGLPASGEVRLKMRLVRRDCLSFLLPEMLTHLRKSLE